MVIANVEVQERVLFQAAPVAAEQALAIGDVEGAGDGPPVALGEHQLHVLRHVREGVLVELLVEPAPPPHELVDGAAVEGVGQAREA